MPTNPEQIVEAVRRWQADWYVHPLTCGNDSGHENLVPELGESETGVVLVCLDCDYRQPLHQGLANLVAEHRTWQGPCD